jgi:hypothetical protein
MLYSKRNVINLTDRLVLQEILSWFGFMHSRIFPSWPDRLHGSLKNMLQVIEQASDPLASVGEK